MSYQWGPNPKPPTLRCLNLKQHEHVHQKGCIRVIKHRVTLLR